MSTPLLKEVLPTVTEALRASLGDEGRPDLAAQLDVARVVSLCGCRLDACLSFDVDVPVASPSSEGATYEVIFSAAVVTIGLRDGRLAVIQDEMLGACDVSELRRVREYEALSRIVTQRHFDQTS